MERIVILGGGFGGLYAAKALRGTPAHVTLIDRRNYHLFQPLLYQVATGSLSPGDIAGPLRSILKKSTNLHVLMDEILDIDPERKEVVLTDDRVPYDTLIVSTGTRHHYFGHDEWAANAPGLKSMEQALEVRNRIFNAFEQAEKEDDPEPRRAWLRFVIVGGGPTGVELAGALAEISRKTVREDFRNFDSADAEILLLEGQDRLLPTYPPDLSAKARHALERLGVKVMLKTFLKDMSDDCAVIDFGDGPKDIPARTILWGAGVKASHLGEVLQTNFGAELDNVGRVQVQPDLTIGGHPEVFVIGDLAIGPNHVSGVAQVAIQGGQYVAKTIRIRRKGQTLPPFHYRDKGNIAVIGRNSAVAQIGKLHLAGLPAWIIWAVVHIAYLIGFDNKLVVMVQWAWGYITFNRSARLIYLDRGGAAEPKSRV
ncbi:MAG: NAD(P)/FAD-dependent oxidoreductase [Fimbriimonadales bacterium]